MAENDGHRARMRERFLKSGIEGFTERECLELLLSYAIPRRDTKPTAQELLKHFGGLSRVLEADMNELMLIDGIAETSASLIMLILPLIRVYQKSKAKETPRLEFLSARKAYARALLMGEAHEHFEVIALGEKGRLLADKRISSGDDRHAAVFPRLIAGFLLNVGASACIIAHNHPSGGAEPSDDDIALTSGIAKALKPLSIELVDHIIISAGEAYSFSENNRL